MGFGKEPGENIMVNLQVLNFKILIRQSKISADVGDNRLPKMRSILPVRVHPIVRQGCSVSAEYPFPFTKEYSDSANIALAYVIIDLLFLRTNVYICSLMLSQTTSDLATRVMTRTSPSCDITNPTLPGYFQQ